MRIILAIISFVALVGAIIWWITQPDWEPAVTSIGLFGALLAQIFTSDEIKQKIKIKIEGKKDSHNYQSGGDQTITDNKKILKGGKDAENYQAEVLVVNKGLTIEETRSIALDVYKANMMDFSVIAASDANSRAEEITEKILDKIAESNNGFSEFQKPGMQDALYRTQKEYAISGDKDLGDLLVDIISDRAQTPERNMLQIVLDESLNVAPKITIEQLDTLTLIFLLIKTRRLDCKNYEEFKLYLRNNIFPFVDNLLSDREHYNFLEYLRCGQIRTGTFGKLEVNLKGTYKGFFSKGFSQEELDAEFENSAQFNRLFIPCFHDNTKRQFATLDDEGLKALMTKRNIEIEAQPKLEAFFTKTTMSDNEVKELLENLDDKMKKIFEVWNSSLFKNFDLSSMGIAIAHANYRRRTNEAMDLTNWIK